MSVAFWVLLVCFIGLAIVVAVLDVERDALKARLDATEEALSTVSEQRDCYYNKKRRYEEWFNAMNLDSENLWTKTPKPIPKSRKKK